MTILITGGLGHIGSKLVANLLLTEDVIVVDSLKTQRYCSLFNLEGTKKCYFLQSSVQDLTTDSIDKVATPRAIIHLAADNDSMQIEAEAVNVEDTNNYTSTLSAARIAEYFDIPLIFPSTTSVYGSIDEVYADEFSRKSSQMTRYATIKSREEDVLLQSNKFGQNARILRLATIYGVSSGMRFHTAVNKFCFLHAIGQDVEIWGSALQSYRPYLSIDDACAGFLHVINNWQSVPEIVNLVSANLRVSDIIKTIEIKSHRKVALRLIANPFDMGSVSFKVSNALAQSNGFEFTDDLESQIEKTLDLFRGIGVHE